jgi:hypothetical protein
MYVSMCMCVRIYVCSVCMSICMHICIHVTMYIYVHKYIFTGIGARNKLQDNRGSIFCLVPHFPYLLVWGTRN